MSLKKKRNKVFANLTTPIHPFCNASSATFKALSSKLEASTLRNLAYFACVLKCICQKSTRYRSVHKPDFYVQQQLHMHISPFFLFSVYRIDCDATERDRSTDAHMAPKERKNMRHATYLLVRYSVPSVACAKSPASTYLYFVFSSPAIATVHICLLMYIPVFISAI